MELHIKLFPTTSCSVKYPIMQPQWDSTFPNRISSYKPRVGSYRAALINITCRTSGNDNAENIVLRFATNLYLPRLPTCKENAFSAAASSPTYLQPNHHAPRVQFRMHTCEKTRTAHGICISVQSPPVNVSINSGQNPSEHGLGDEPPPVAASNPISVLHKNSKSERLFIQNQEKQKTSSSKSRAPPPEQHDQNRKTYPCTNPRFLAPPSNAAP